MAGQKPLRPNPESRRGDGAVLKWRRPTHRCKASRSLAEATKSNVAVLPPSLARWAREGLGERVGSYTSTSSSRSKPPELIATIACARTAGLAR